MIDRMDTLEFIAFTFLIMLTTFETVVAFAMNGAF